MAGPRLQLLRGARRHERHRNGAGGRRPGAGVRPRALRRAPGGVRLCRGADPAPGHAQGPRRRRPDLLASRGRPDDGGGGDGPGPAHRGDAAGAVRASGAHAAARLPHRLPTQPRRRARRRRRPVDAQRPRTRTARPRRPGAAARRDRRGAGDGPPPAVAGRPAEWPDRPGAVQAELHRGSPLRRRRPRAGDRPDGRDQFPLDAAARAPGRGGVGTAVGEVPPGRRPGLPDARVAGARG